MTITVPIPTTVLAILANVMWCHCAVAVVVDTVVVANPGNPDDETGYGAVSDVYRIGTYEVTNDQYTEFLNAVDVTGANSLSLYSANMSSSPLGGISFSVANADGSKYSVKLDREHNPVNYVSWYDAVRFANWLHNGQGKGDTENGAYTLLGGSPTPSNGTAVARNSDATWFVPSENEWYKAAYHKNNGATRNYFDYPTSSDTVPFSDQPSGQDAPTQTNTANFFKDDFLANHFDDGYAVTGSPVFDSSQNYLTDVGSFVSSPSPYGTFDQAGNVWEWNEDGSLARGARGGFWSARPFNLLASSRSGLEPYGEWNDVGFRVANVPEPAGSLFLIVGLLGVNRWPSFHRRKR